MAKQKKAAVSKTPPKSRRKMAKKVTTLVIDRSRWGTGSLGGELQAPDNSTKRAGLRCCLGFYCLAAGYAEKQITRRGMPASLASSNKLPEWLLDRDPQSDVNKLAKINDALISTNREERIKKIFAKHGVKVRFIGKLATPKAVA
jgi:hypothetical protein